MTFRGVPLWKKAPFIRLLLPLIAGIILQWYLQPPLALWWYVMPGGFLFLLLLFFIPFFGRFRFSWLNGIAISFVFISMGALLVWFNDIRQHSRWVENYYKNTSAV